MESRQARVRIRLDDAEIEAEGSEEFVRAELRTFWERLPTGRAPSADAAEPAQMLEASAPAAVSADAGGARRPSLAEFHAEKAPEGHFETVPVLACYFKRFENLEEITEEQIDRAYDQLGIRKPSRIRQTLADIRSKKGWLASGSRPGSYRLTNQGWNLVQHDLPRGRTT